MLRNQSKVAMKRIDIVYGDVITQLQKRRSKLKTGIVKEYEVNLEALKNKRVKLLTRKQRIADFQKSIDFKDNYFTFLQASKSRYKLLEQATGIKIPDTKISAITAFDIQSEVDFISKLAISRLPNLLGNANNSQNQNSYEVTKDKK